jgi:hypothetical protein
MRGISFAPSPASGGWMGETLMRTPRTPSSCISGQLASDAFSSTSTMPRHGCRIAFIASSMQLLSRAYALGCTKTKRSKPFFCAHAR